MYRVQGCIKETHGFPQEPTGENRPVSKPWARQMRATQGYQLPTAPRRVPTIDSPRYSSSVLQPLVYFGTYVLT
jgi:hypothetical protein